MPHLRGITLNILLYGELKQYPEFPHPESFHPSYGAASRAQTGTETQCSSSVSSMTPKKYEDPLLRRTAAAAVYIPSVPNTRFSLKYNVAPPYPDGVHLYFRLFMNGRHINSWGINPRLSPRGQISRALYLVDLKDEHCLDVRAAPNSATEARTFNFGPVVEGQLAANDGGLIEIMVFRARGRQSRDPDKQTCRPQEQYGISLPSAGLVRTPQDTKYYDWHLIDAKTTPYATFKFHYRSWDSLRSLHLIPEFHPRSLLPTSRSYQTLTNATQRHQPSKDLREEDTDGESDYFSAASVDGSALAHTRSKLVSILNRSDGGPEADSQVPDAGTPPKQTCSRIQEAMPLQISMSEILKAPAAKFPLTKEALDRWTRERPLPPLPSDRSRASSRSSNATSISPSLLRWVESDSRESSPDPIVGIATAVRIVNLSDDEDSLSEYSDSSFSDALATAPSLSAPPRFSLRNGPDNVVRIQSVFSVEGAADQYQNAQLHIPFSGDIDEVSIHKDLEPSDADSEDSFSTSRETSEPPQADPGKNEVATPTEITRDTEAVYGYNLSNVGFMYEDAYQWSLDNENRVSTSSHTGEEEPDLLVPGAWHTWPAGW